MRGGTPDVWTSLAAALLALTLTFERGACELDTASLIAVPPSTVKVVETWTCGGLTCWVRYVVTDGKRLGESTICDQTRGDGLEARP
jgi:hypothetical protein